MDRLALLHDAKKSAAQQGLRYKKDPGRARGETFECENVPPPESP